MIFDKESLVLYSIHISKVADSGITRSQMSNRLDIKPSTLDYYLSSLTKKGYIQRGKRRYSPNKFDTITITDIGNEKIEKIQNDISKNYFTPEHHSIAIVIPLKNVFDQLRNPLDKILLLSIYNSKSSFNLPEILHNIKLPYEETSLVNIFDKMEFSENEKNSFSDTFSRCSFLGINDLDSINISDIHRDEINALLLMAESERRRGELLKSENQFKAILKSCRNISQHHWFIASFNLAMIEYLRNHTDHSFSLFDEIQKSTSEKTYLAYIDHAKAFIYSKMEEYDKANKLFNSSIRSFRKMDNQLLLSLALNNRGVLYFKMEDYKNAESEWIKALKIARKVKSNCIISMTYENLSDIEMKRGNHKKADRLLTKAESLHKRVGDLEKLSGLEFNRTLLAIELKDIDEIKYHFLRSETIAYPLPPHYEKIERRKVIIQRMKDKGLSDINIF